jgi:hypothetical protein
MAEVTPKFRPPRPPTGIQDNNASGKPRRTNEEIERSNKQAQQRLKLSLKKKDMLLGAPRAPPPPTSTFFSPLQNFDSDSRTSS